MWEKYIFIAPHLGTLTQVVLLIQNWVKTASYQQYSLNFYPLIYNRWLVFEVRYYFLRQVLVLQVLHLEILQMEVLDIPLHNENVLPKAIPL